MTNEQPDYTSEHKPAQTFTPGDTNSLLPVNAAALGLFYLGLNVTIQPYASKGGLPWGHLMTARLSAADLVAVIRVYASKAGKVPNLAVIVGRTSGNLAVIDCETPQAFDYWRAILAQAGVPLCTVETAKGGHLYVRVTDGPIKSVAASAITGDHAGEYEIRGEGGYVLAAGSVHPSGVIYRWRDQGQIPELTIEQLQAFGLAAQPATPRRRGGGTVNPSLQKPAGPFDGYNLSNRTKRFLEHGAPVGSRNNELYRAALDCAGCGVPYSTGYDWLIAAAVGAGEDDRKAHGTIQRAYSKAGPGDGSREYYGMTGGGGRAIPEWRRAESWISGQQWTGRTGPSTRAVAVALIERARVGGSSGLFRAAVRELAELARCTPNTAQKALQRLQGRDFVQWAGTDQRSGGNLWKFGPAVAATGTPAGFAPVGPRRSPTGAIDPDGRDRQRCESDTLPYTGKLDSVSITHRSAGTDAAERGALGPVAVVVYREITLRPARSQAEIAARCGLSIDQVKRALAKLRALAPEGLPLVTYTRAGGYVGHERSDDWLDQHIAEPAGTLGAADRRRAKHEQQRSARARDVILSAILGDRPRGQSRRRSPVPRRTGNPYLDTPRELVSVPRSTPSGQPPGPP